MIFLLIGVFEKKQSLSVKWSLLVRKMRPLTPLCKAHTEGKPRRKVALWSRVYC